MNLLYQSLNLFFLVFHSSLVVFNVFGWIPKMTRFYNLITQTLTAFSWFVLGIWYGWGYCFCTDWHWRIREQLGYHDISNSYIHFLIIQYTGINLPETLVENVTLMVFLITFFMSIVVNGKDFLKKRRPR